MDRQQRIELILDHYESPRHNGVLGVADIVRSGTTPGCGDRVTIYAQVGDGGCLQPMSFDGNGCTISQAAASMTVEMMQGWTLEQVAQAGPDAILNILGTEIAASRQRCATLALDTLKAAVLDYSVGRP